MPFQLSAQFRETSKTGVPLIVWGYALALAVFLARGAFWLMLRDTPPSEAFFLHNANRLQVLKEKTSAAASGVVILGDSRVRYAIHDDAALSQRLTALHGSRVEVVRITANWAVFEDFRPLAEHIFATKPSLILVQEELLAKERAQPGRLLTGRAYLLWRVFGTGAWNPGGLDQHELQSDIRCVGLANDDIQTRKERVYRWVSFEPKGRNNRLLTAFATGARDRGIAIEYFAVPITSRGQAELPSFQRDGATVSLVPPVHIPDSSFCDVVHMNPEGRAVYSDWFTQEVVNLLRGAEH